MASLLQSNRDYAALNRDRNVVKMQQATAWTQLEQLLWEYRKVGMHAPTVIIGPSLSSHDIVARIAYVDSGVVSAIHGPTYEAAILNTVAFLRDSDAAATAWVVENVG